MSTAAHLPGVIRDKLSAMDRQRRELAAVSGLGEFLCLGSLAVGVCLLADAYGNLAPVWRAGLLIGLACTLLAGFWFRVLSPFWRRRTWAELAAAVEQDHPELKERLTTLVELRSDAQAGRVSSPLMQDLLAKQTVKAVSHVEFTETLPAGRSLQRGALGLAALAVLLLPFLLPGSRYALSWQRLLAPWANHDWGNRLTFHIPDGDRVVAKGSDVSLQAELIGPQPSAGTPLAVQLRWVDEQGRSQQRSMTWNADDQTYATTIPRVEQSFRYQLTSRSAVSREYHITAADRPRIAAWHMEIQPPSYTGLPAQTLDSVIGELTVPEQSRLAFRWQFAEPVAAAVIAWPETFTDNTPQKSDDALPETKTRTVEQTPSLSADRRSATIELPATADGPFEIRLTSDLGLESDEPPHTLVLIPDQPPEIAVVKADSVTSIQPDDVLPIPLIVDDDYGLSAVELHWETSTGQRGSRAVPPDELTGRHLEFQMEMDVADWKLTSGQSVTYRLRAVDNRPSPGPQETWTEPVTVAVSSQADLVEARELAAAQAALERELDALKDAVAEQRQAVDKEHRDTAREAVRGDQQPENQQELTALQKQQQALRDQLETLREELQQRPLMEQTAKEHLPQIEQKLADAERALEQAADAKEARDQIEKLSQSLDDLAQAENQLEQLKQESKALAALEQELAELGRLSRKADKLADQAETLQHRTDPSQEAAKPPASAQSQPEGNNSPQSEPAPGSATAKTESPPAAEELERLRKETAELTEHLDDLLRRRPELLEAARQNELERLARLAEMAERLAEPQAQLAEAMTREAETESPAAPSDAAVLADDKASNNPPAADSRSESAPDNNTPAANPDGADSPERPASEPQGQNPANPNDAPDSDQPDAQNAESPTAESPGGESPAPNREQKAPDENAPTLPQQVASAVQQQQQLAREAAALQRSSPSSPEKSEPSDSASSPKSAPGEAIAPEKSTADQPAADGEPTPNRSSDEALADFADQSKSAAAAAQAGDLQQAAEQSRQASQSAQQAAKSESASNGEPNSPAAEQAGELADRQQALAKEFERLAQSAEARQQAQQQSQQQLQNATESLTKALQQSAEQLSQQPLNLAKPGDSASAASQSAKSAGESMKAAAESLAKGDPSAAGQQAQAAREQLQEAAQQAQQAQGGQPSASPQSGNVPAKPASQVARAANRLKQAQEHLAQAENAAATPSSSPGTSPAPGEQPSESSPSTPGQPSQKTGNPPGESSSKSNHPPGESSPKIGEQPGEPAAESTAQDAQPPSELEQSVEQLRQAAKSLAAACKACQKAGGKPGSGSKPGSPGQPGSARQPGSQIAESPAEPGEPGQPLEGFSALGMGGSDPSEDLESLTEAAKPSAGMRNWGRLPKNLQTEILQGSTKKSHPEYSRQIKNYFEQIARPAAKQDRP